MNERVAHAIRETLPFALAIGGNVAIAAEAGTNPGAVGGITGGLFVLIGVFAYGIQKVGPAYASYVKLRKMDQLEIDAKQQDLLRGSLQEQVTRLSHGLADAATRVDRLTHENDRLTTQLEVTVVSLKEMQRRVTMEVSAISSAAHTAAHLEPTPHADEPGVP